MRNDPSDDLVNRYFAAVDDARPFGLRFFVQKDDKGDVHDVLYVGNELVVAPRGLLTSPVAQLGEVSGTTTSQLEAFGGHRCDERRSGASRLGRVQVWRFVDADGNPRDARRVLAALRDDLVDTVTLHHGFVSHQKMHPGTDPEMPPAGCQLAPPDRASVAGEGVRIAVLDSGCTVSAGPDLLAGVSGDPEVLLVPGLLDPQKTVLAHSAAHGTFIASLIKQVAPRAEVHVRRVLDTLGVTTEAKLVDALSALPADTHIVSLSLGAYASELAKGRTPAAGSSGGIPPQYLGAAVLDLLDRGIAVVASAGNDEVTARTYPAAYPGVVGVAALERDGQTPWPQTNRGEWVQACAVGADLNGLFVRGDEDPYWEDDPEPESWTGTPSFANWSGTSFAAPLVAAVIANGISQRAAGALPKTVADAVLDAAPPGPAGCGAFIEVSLPPGV